MLAFNAIETSGREDCDRISRADLSYTVQSDVVMVRKSPGFTFYPDSWIGGTLLLSTVEKAVYIDLLCMQWLHGPFTRDHALRACRGVQADDVDAVLRLKFTEGDDGNFANSRLEEERTKQATFRDKQRENGAKGGRPKTQTKPKNNPGLSSGETQTKPNSKPKHNPTVSVSVSDSVLVSDSDSDSDKTTALRAVCSQLVAEPAGSSAHSEYVFAMQSGVYWLPTTRLREYEATYAWDVHAELRKATLWLKDNPARRPRGVEGMKRFLTSWLNRTDGRGGASGAMQHRTQTQMKLENTLLAIEDFANGE